MTLNLWKQYGRKEFCVFVRTPTQVIEVYASPWEGNCTGYFNDLFHPILHCIHLNHARMSCGFPNGRYNYSPTCEVSAKDLLRIFKDHTLECTNAGCWTNHAALSLDKTIQVLLPYIPRTSPNCSRFNPGCGLSKIPIFQAKYIFTTVIKVNIILRYL